MKKEENVAKIKIKRESKAVKIFKKIGFKRTVVLLVIFILFFIILKNSIPEIFHNSIVKTENYYIKNNDLYYNKEKIGNDIYDISFAEKENLTLNELNDISNMNFKPIYDENKKLSIYFCNFNIDEKTADLKIEGYGKNFTNIIIKNIDTDFVKVAKDLNSAIYIKNENDKKNLYLNNLNTEILVDSEVSEFYATDDLLKVYYIKNNDFYVYENKNNILIATDSQIIKEETKISFDEILSINNYDFIYYKKYTDRNRNIFDIYKVIGDEKKEIATGATGDIICYYYDDYIYFNKNNIEELKVKDYVNDDITDGSFYLKEPDINNYRDSFFGIMPDYFSYYTDKSNFDAIVNYINRNKETIEKYEKQIEKGTFNNYYKKLYYYDGKDNDEIGDMMIKNIYKVNTDDPYILFMTYEIDELQKIDKVNLSDIIANNMTVNSYMKTVRREAKTFTYLYHKNEGARITEFEASEDIYIYKLKNDFLIKTVNGANQFLYRLKFTPNALCKAVKTAGFLTNDIELFTSEESDDIYYSIMYGSSNSYFYRNEEEIENKIHTGYVKASRDLNKIYYFTDFDDNKKTGTLKMYEQGRRKTIDENVLLSSLKIDLENTDIYYIKNYNNVTLSGDLYRYDNFNKKHLTDNDVLNYLENNTNYYRKIYKNKDMIKTTKTKAGEDLGEKNYQEF